MKLEIYFEHYNFLTMREKMKAKLHVNALGVQRWYSPVFLKTLESSKYTPESVRCWSIPEISTILIETRLQSRCRKDAHSGTRSKIIIALLKGRAIEERPRNRSRYDEGTNELLAINVHDDNYCSLHIIANFAMRK